MKDRVSVQHLSEIKGLGVVAEQFFPAGSIVASARVVSICPERTSYSVETDSGQHVLMDEPGVCINHSCQPTTQPRSNTHGAYDFIAALDIQKGEEITFDYVETETDVVQPFPCDCGSVDCRKMVTGRLVPA